MQSGKDNVPEGIISVKTEKVASSIHSEHGDSQFGPYIIVSLAFLLNFK